MNFEGKTALITGAARGIGRATAVGFARNGANVILADIADVSETYEEAKKYTTNIMKLNFDVSNESDAKKPLQNLLRNSEKLTFLSTMQAYFLNPILQIPHPTSGKR